MILYCQCQSTSCVFTETLTSAISSPPITLTNILSQGFHSKWYRETSQLSPAVPRARKDYISEKERERERENVVRETADPLTVNVLGPLVRSRESHYRDGGGESERERESEERARERVRERE